MAVNNGNLGDRAVETRFRHNRAHVLSRDDFFALARGQGSHEFVRFLWRAQRSRRLLLIKALLDRVERAPDVLGPLRPADAVWRVLVRAQQADPAAVDALILHPQVGTAISFALRRLTDASEAGPGDVVPPLWVDCGQIHLVALVAAARAKLTWQTAVPLRAGTLMLPTLGLAHFPPGEPWDHAMADTEGGRITLRYRGHEVRPGVDGPGWWGLRRVRVGTDPELCVWLDDLDPFRDLADPVRPHRLTETAAARWHDLLDAAWQILAGDQPQLVGALAAGVTSVVPLPAADGWDNRSASTGEAFGSVMVSPPTDATSLAVSLVHEFQHIKLGGLLHLVTLTGGETQDGRPESSTLYAPWRDDPRPLGGLVQGAYAFLGIATFWRSHRKNLAGTEERLATFEYAYAREQTREALHILRASSALTPLGREFLDHMHEHLTSWLDDEISPSVAELVRLAVDGHRAGWRIRHLRPSSAAVSTVVDAWLSGHRAPASGEGRVTGHDQDNWSRGRLGLVRRRLLAPDRVAEVLGAAEWAQSLIEPDIALVSGDPALAQEGYLRHLRTDPTHLDAWTGLGLAARAAGAVGASTVLLGRPDLVLAVDRAIRAAGQTARPLELASWLGSATG